MITITFNEEVFPLIEFSRNTYLSEGQVESNIYCSLESSAIAPLYDLFQVDITSIIIKRDNVIIYDAGNTTSHLLNVSENLNEGRITTSVNLRVD